MRRYLHYICLLLISALFFIFAACSVVGVEHISKEEWLKNRMTNALNSNSLSNDTRSVMEQAGISDKYADDPKAAIAELQAMFDAAKTPSYAAALAEMCYLQGKNDDSIRYYMSSIFFSLQYLGMAGAHYDGLSAKSNTVAVYYNFSLLEVFKFLKDHNLLQFKSYQIPSIYGDITFSAPEFHKAITDEWIRALIPVYELHPVGLRVYSFKAGIGLPLAESVDILKEVSEGKDIVLNPVTMILSIQTKDGCPLGARLEFFDPLKTENVSIEGKEFPLESDYTTPLAEVLNNPPLIKGIEFMLFPDDIGTYSGLYMMFDYDPDKIPVVFVHGLMSNPRTWSKALNSLLDDPVIRKHYQFWAFAYATGDPVIYSAALLRKDLLEKQKKYSPDGNNPNFNKMVIVSHSMGGLVSSLMVKDSGQALSDKLLDVPIDKLNIKPEQKEFLLEMLVFKSLPFIKTVVFISVPHRGSELATYDVVIDAAKFIVLPTRLAGPLLEAYNKALVKMKIHENKDPLFISTGINNLDPDNLTLMTIEGMSYAPDVTYHTISGDIVNPSPLPGATDGIVPYWSSHLDNVASEKIVTSGHSVQDTNQGVKEIHRILIENLSLESEEKNADNPIP